MPRLNKPEGGYADPTESMVREFLDGDGEIEAQIAELADQLKVLKRSRHDHRKQVIETHRLFTPSAESAKSFARGHTNYECKLDLVVRFMTYKALGVFDQDEMFPFQLEKGEVRTAQEQAA